MKTKLLLGAFLFLIPVNMCLAHTKHKYKYKHRGSYIHSEKVKERSVFLPTANADRIDNTLLLSFQFSLEATDITIVDENGTIVYQQQTYIVEGNTVSFEIKDYTLFPLSVKIESPTTLIEGEIIEE